MSTIVAISTAPGIGGIGIIRMSGEDCFEILEKIFKAKNPKKIEEIKGYTIKYGNIINKKNEIIDEVLVSYFKAPKSYTSENMCEISSHGGIVIMNKILEECIKNGAILAEPGEFTKRAFLNGRLDLSQAEAVIDVINSKTEKESKISQEQLQGFLSEKIGDIRKELLDLMSDIEANIDYPEYDIEEVTNEKIEKILDDVSDKLDKLEKSFSAGKIIRDGIKTATVCSKSGLLATDLCREAEGTQVYTEYFAEGTVPTEKCDTHVKAKVCNKTGKLASDNCTDTSEKVFITRENSEKDTSWKKANDAKYMLPTETCEECKKEEMT